MSDRQPLDNEEENDIVHNLHGEETLVRKSQDPPNSAGLNQGNGQFDAFHLNEGQ